MNKEIIHLIKHINNDFNVYLRAELKAHKIPIKTKHADLFVILYEEGNKIEFKNLVKAWKKSKSTLSETVKKYVEAGILKKEQTSLDKRIVYISLTQLGESYSEAFGNIYNNYSSYIVNNIKEDKQAIFNSILNEIVEGIKV